MKELIDKAKEIRKAVFKLAVKENDGHIAPALSIVDMLVTIYSNMKEEDKFILSKGHACLSYYAVLNDLGYNPEFCNHPEIQLDQGIPCSTGSLGHGLPIAIGMAFALKHLKKKGHIYVIVGDGECQEGTVWESLNLARKFKDERLYLSGHLSPYVIIPQTIYSYTYNKSKL